MSVSFDNNYENIRNNRLSECLLIYSKHAKYIEIPVVYRLKLDISLDALLTEKKELADVRVKNDMLKTFYREQRRFYAQAIK